MITIGEQVLIYRKRRKMTQSQLANKAGISRNYISLIESGFDGLTLKVLRAIFLALGCKVVLNVFPPEDLDSEVERDPDQRCECSHNCQ